MKKFSAARYFFTALTILMICSCSPDPGMELVEDFDFSFENITTQRLLEGESVELAFRAVNNQNPVDNSVKLLYEAIKGGGSVQSSLSRTGTDGLDTISWTLGADSFEQVLRASVYNMSGMHLTDMYRTAYCFRDDEWQKITGDFDSEISGIVTDTLNNVTFMVARNKLYRQRERYFMWEEVKDEILQKPKMINIDCNGVIYVSTVSGELIKSVDHGVSWSSCTRPYPNDQYIYVYISNDNYIWVFGGYQSIRLSKDGGLSWRSVYIDNYPTSGSIFRLSNGSLLYHGSEWRYFYRSDDDGLTWKGMLVTPGCYSLYVNDNDEIFITNGDNGFSIYRSTDMGLSWEKMHSVYPPYGSRTVEEAFKRWGNSFYIIVPGYGILKSSDLVNYEDYWVNFSLGNLYYDHNGVFIVKDFLNQSVYYRRNSK
jgi:hypothetical protein